MFSLDPFKFLRNLVSLVTKCWLYRIQCIIYVLSTRGTLSTRFTLYTEWTLISCPANRFYFQTWRTWTPRYPLKDWASATNITFHTSFALQTRLSLTSCYTICSIRSRLSCIFPNVEFLLLFLLPFHKTPHQSDQIAAELTWKLGNRFVRIGTLIIIIEMDPKVSLSAAHRKAPMLSIALSN